MKILIISLFIVAICEGISIAEHSLYDFHDLNEYAKITSIAYCLKKGLSVGRLGDEDNYCPLEICQNLLRELDIIEIVESKNWDEDACGFIALDHVSRSIMIVFRGSSSRRDWFRNIDIIPVPYTPLVILNGMTEFSDGFSCDDCMVHRGFYQILQETFPALIHTIQKLFDEYSYYTLVISGHSLGAALTLLVGVEFQLLGYEPLVVSFAGPKVGDIHFAQFVDKIFDIEAVSNKIDSEDKFEKGYIRVVHKNDAVPFLPPLYTYQHCGYKYFINKKELPHSFESLERKGYNDEDLVNNLGNPGKLWMEPFGKYEHTHYFVRITGCKEEED